MQAHSTGMWKTRVCLQSTIAVLLLLIQSPSSGAPSKCETCRQIAKGFKQGLEKTAKSNFGGGNTNWEEEKLGSFASSETRFIEILEHVCDDGSKECHHMVEDQEEALEKWFFSHYNRGIDLDLELFMCIDNLRECCPEGTYGTDCVECPGGKERPCSGNGRCVGSGTRDGSGTCSCNAGYEGDLCTVCASAYYEESKNESHTVCQACDRACNNCVGSGRKNCLSCRDGWKQDESEGCTDIDECLNEVNPCNDGEYCLNNDGSYSCQRCDPACIGCTGAGSSNCKSCNVRYYQEDGSCKRCHSSCAASCADDTPETCDSCAEGWQVASDGRTCEDVDECALNVRSCESHSYCVNTEGSSYCSPCHSACNGCNGPSAADCLQCRVGYTQNTDSNECTDIDECAADGSAAPCTAIGEKCINTVGAFRCECDVGFQRRSGKCEPKKKPPSKKKEKEKLKKQKPSENGPDFSSSPLTKDAGQPLEGQPIDDEMIVMEGKLNVPDSQTADSLDNGPKDSGSKHDDL